MCLFFGEATTLHFLEDGEHLAAIDKLEDEVEAARVLKIVVKRHNEFGLHTKEDIFFIVNVIDLLIRHDKFRFPKPAAS